MQACARCPRLEELPGCLAAIGGDEFRKALGVAGVLVVTTPHARELAQCLCEVLVQPVEETLSRLVVEDQPLQAKNCAVSPTSARTGRTAFLSSGRRATGRRGRPVPISSPAASRSASCTWSRKSSHFSAARSGCFARNHSYHSPASARACCGVRVSPSPCARADCSNPAVYFGFPISK